MPCRYIVDHMERTGVGADARLASTTSSLIHRLEDNTTVGILLKFLERYPIDQLDLLEHCKVMFNTPGPEGYAHPDDMELSVLVYLLWECQTEGLIDFMNEVVDKKDPAFSQLVWLCILLLKRLGYDKSGSVG